MSRTYIVRQLAKCCATIRHTKSGNILIHPIQSTDSLVVLVDMTEGRQQFYGQTSFAVVLKFSLLHRDIKTVRSHCYNTLVIPPSYNNVGMCVQFRLFLNLHTDVRVKFSIQRACTCIHRYIHMHIQYRPTYMPTYIHNSTYAIMHTFGKMSEE